MAKRKLLVIGAAGDVGQGIVKQALASDRQVIAAGRNPDRLEALAALHENEPLVCIAGDISSEAGASSLWDSAVAAFGGIDDVVVSVNSANRLQKLADWSAKELSAALDANLLTHFIAAKIFLPRLPDTGMLIGIGGGTADFLFPKMTPVSMAQAALRMFFRGLAKERESGADLRELMIDSMVAGHSNRDTARPEWVTDDEVGLHICAILDAPDDFSGPILKLRSRDQVGKPGN